MMTWLGDYGKRKNCTVERNVLYHEALVLVLKVFLMLLQDSKKHSEVAPGTEVEPQSLRPPECPPGCYCEYQVP